jgi:hypothetical protein
MPGKPKARIHEAAKGRLTQALNDPHFVNALDAFDERWVIRGYPNLFSDEREEDWDEARRCNVYRGLYYTLMKLCADFGLWWQYDSGYLMRLLHAKKFMNTSDPDARIDSLIHREHPEMKRLPLNIYLEKCGHPLDQLIDQIKPAECPPEEHWKWFRMARNGLGLPEEQEVRDVEHLMSEQERQSALTNGLTHTDIATLCSSNQRTVQEAIRMCWHFLEYGGADLRQIVERAGLDDSDGWMLMIVPTLKKWRESPEYKQQRKHRPTRSLGQAARAIIGYPLARAKPET